MKHYTLEDAAEATFDSFSRTGISHKATAGGALAGYALDGAVSDCIDLYCVMQVVVRHNSYFSGSWV